MTKSFAEILKEIFEDIIKEEKEQAEEQNRTEKTIEVLDRDITFGVRDRVCKENRCGSTDCPLYVDGDCINRHLCDGITVKIPTRIIDAEAEDRKVRYNER